MKVSGLPCPLPPQTELREAMATQTELMPCTTDTKIELDRARSIGNALRQSILHAAFTGKLVPQDPTDEPVAALLARLRGAPALGRRTRRRTPAEAPA